MLTSPHGRGALDSRLGVADAGRDALIAAALDPPGAALDAWRAWVRAAGDGSWRDPVAERWLPLIGANLAQADLDASTQARFREAALAMCVVSGRAIHAARPAIDALRDAGIQSLVLKGAALSSLVYEQAGLRAVCDVDVLVPPADAGRAQDVLAALGWRMSRDVDSRDRALVHALDFRKPPHGALDLHLYLLTECCWPGVDRGLWQRARPLPAWGDDALTLSPADHLLHVCLHGLRWSPVHGGYWIADAARILRAAEDTLDWGVVVDEAAARHMTRQMHDALLLVSARGHVAVPEEVVRALAGRATAWYEGWESRFKGRPVVSPAGMFVVWTSWLRTAKGARMQGAEALPWPRYLAARFGVGSPARVPLRLARHLWRGMLRWLRRTPRRGATSQVRF